ncbi:MAG TPA: potassium channel family protein [Lysobacter sp.]|nr:potassium channel family protein [Lysobacter sp.]
MDWLIPTEQFGEHLLVAVIAFLVTALVVVIHYEGVHWLARRYAGRTPKRDRTAMLRIIFALLALHIVEIWCYGLTYWGLTKIPDAGFVHGTYGVQGAHTLFDAVYLSAITFSTVGFGDLAPVGAIRLVSGMESLTGLLLITWSASFTYLEMSRLWRERVD